jgi:hypothetical protein
MPRTTSADQLLAIRTILDGLRGSGQGYPCSEADLIQLVSAAYPMKPATVKRLLSKDDAIVRLKKSTSSRAPYFVAFPGDERLIFQIDENSVTQLLEKSGKPLSWKEIAAKLRIPSEPPADTFLREHLEIMVESNRLRRDGSNYHLPVKARDLDIIEAVGELKKAFSYPASVRNVAKRMPPPKLTEAQVKKLLDDMTETGAFRKVKSGKSTLYLFEGDDSRYVLKASEDLKFKLLAEIESLRTQLAEYRQEAVPSPAQPSLGGISDAETISGRIMAALDEETRLSGKRTVELTELRRKILDVPREQLDQALQDLGSSRTVELKPVQDITKLSRPQCESLLKLLDGTMILAVARLNRRS